MNRSRTSFSALVTATALAIVCPLRAASEAEAAAGRALVKRYADAIVGVELVVTLKMKVGDREAPAQERRIEVNGTVISASGLTLTSLADVDPQAAYEASRANASGGRGVELVGVDFKEVKLRLADGKEVPARFVLKDADLDLAFMAPEASEGGAEYPHVSLESAADGALMGNYFSVARAPKSLQRVPLVRLNEIVGIVEKPRRFYLLSDLQFLGTPVFDGKGAVLGVTLQNFANGRRSIMVLPAGDIAEMAKQAAAAQKTPPPASATAEAKKD
jgi:S1-C subfamily serine protease